MFNQYKNIIYYKYRMEKKIYESKQNVLEIINIIGSSEYYFGIEIEIEFNSENEKNIFVYNFYDNFSNWILKKEISIKCGLEIVSAPMTYDIILEQIDLIVQFCNQFNAKTSDRTGLHIHVTKSKTNPPDDLRIFQFINNPKNREEIISFSGRLSDYARYTTRTYQKNKSRGYSVNLLNPNTIEFRIFALNLTDSKWIKGCVMFCNLIKKYSNILSSYDQLIELTTQDNYPDFFIKRLTNVNKTIPGFKYPIIYPISPYMQYW